jgi:hypothetical protein
MGYGFAFQWIEKSRGRGLTRIRLGTKNKSVFPQTKNTNGDLIAEAAVVY